MIYIQNTGAIDGILTKKDATKWIKAHVIIKRSDIARIRALAKSLGFLKELEALDIQIKPLAAGKD